MVVQKIIFNVQQSYSVIQTLEMKFVCYKCDNGITVNTYLCSKCAFWDHKDG